jgi:hypothetical protein
VGNDIQGEDAGDHFGTESALSGDGQRLIVGAPFNDGGNGDGSTAYESTPGFEDQGHVRVYQISTVNDAAPSWKQVGSDIDGGEEDASFGMSVAISNDGKRIVVGAPWKWNADESDVTGQVMVLEETTTTTTDGEDSSRVWQPLGAPIFGIQDSELCGSSVAMSDDGKRIAVASLRYSSSTNDRDHYKGRIRIFDFVHNSWQQVGSDILGEAANDQVGDTVRMSADGKRIALSAAFYDPNEDEHRQGYVQVYGETLDAQGSVLWTKLGYDILGESSDEGSGSGLALSGDGQTLAIGAPYHSNDDWYYQGQVRVLTYDTSAKQWTLLGQDAIEGEVSEENLGETVDLSQDGRTLIVGTSTYGRSGNAFVYRYDDLVDQWFALGSNVRGRDQGDFFGAHVSISKDGTRFAASAPDTANDDTEDDFGGYARVYDLQDAPKTDIASISDGDTTEKESDLAVTWQQLGEDMDGEAEGDESGYAISLAGNGQRVAIGSPYNDGDGENESTKDAGHVRVYEYANSDSSLWALVGGSAVNGGFKEDEFGTSVALSQNGKRLAVGAPWSAKPGAQALADGDLVGSVQIFEEQDGTWISLTSTAPLYGSAQGDIFGSAVALCADGTRVAIGAARASGGNKRRRGLVQMYQENAVKGQWEQVGDDIWGADKFDEMGYSVTLSDNGSRVIVAGGWYDFEEGDYRQGYVQVFTLSLPREEGDGAQWTQVGETIFGNLSDDVPEGSGEGISMSADGTVIAIGAQQHTSDSYYDGGSVRVFKEVNGKWTQMGTNIEGDSGAEVGSTIDLSADGRRLVVGAPRHGRKGSVMIYEWQENTSGVGEKFSSAIIAGQWAKLVQEDGSTEAADAISGEVNGDYFGFRVQVSDDGTRIASSAPNNHESADYAGHVRVYELSDKPDEQPAEQPAPSISAKVRIFRELRSDEVYCAALII